MEWAWTDIPDIFLQRDSWCEFNITVGGINFGYCGSVGEASRSIARYEHCGRGHVILYTSKECPTWDMKQPHLLCTFNPFTSCCFSCLESHPLLSQSYRDCGGKPSRMLWINFFFPWLTATDDFLLPTLGLLIWAYFSNSHSENTLKVWAQLFKCLFFSGRKLYHVDNP